MGKEKKKIIYLGFILFWGIYPLGQLVRLPFLFQEINLYLHDLLVIFLIAFSFATRKGQILKNKTKTGKGYFLFGALAFFSWLINLPYWGKEKSFLGLLYLFRWLAYGLIFFIVFDLKKQIPSFKKFLLNLIFLSLAISALLGLFQYLFFPDLRFMSFFDWDPHWYRLTAAWFDPGYTGMIYLLGLIVWFYLKRKNKNRFFVLLGGVLYLAFFLTYSRSAYLAAIVALTLISLFERSRRIFATGIIIFFFTLLLLPQGKSVGTDLERKETIWSRVNNWQKSIVVIKDKPLLGVGFNNYRWIQEEKGWLQKDSLSHAAGGADSSLLFVAATTGLIGLVAFLYLFLIPLFNFNPKTTSDKIMVVTTVSLLIHSFFNHSLFYPWITLCWWQLRALTERG